MESHDREYPIELNIGSNPIALLSKEDLFLLSLQAERDLSSKRKEDNMESQKKFALATALPNLRILFGSWNHLKRSHDNLNTMDVHVFWSMLNLLHLYIVQKVEEAEEEHHSSSDDTADSLSEEIDEFVYSVFPCLEFWDRSQLNVHSFMSQEGDQESDINIKCVRLALKIFEEISGNDFDHLVSMLGQFLCSVGTDWSHFMLSSDIKCIQSRLDMLQCIYSYLCSVIINQYYEQREEMLHKLIELDFWSIENNTRISTLHEMSVLCLQHEHPDVRASFLYVCTELSMLSERICCLLLPILERVLFVDCDELRCFIINSLWEMCIMFPSVRDCSNEETDPERSSLVSYLPQFLDIGSIEMQLVSAHGMCRVLHDDEYPLVHPEQILSGLASKYCRLRNSIDSSEVVGSRKPGRKRKANTERKESADTDARPALVHSYLANFFEVFPRSKKNQETIADTIVSRVIDAIDDKVITISSAAVDPMNDVIIEIRFLVKLLPPRVYSTLMEVLMVNVRNCYQVYDLSYNNLKSWLSIKANQLPE